MTERPRSDDNHANMVRRDFIGTTLIGAGAALLGARAPAYAQNLTSSWNGYAGIGDYARSNGNTADVVNAAHGVRDGRYESAIPAATSVDDVYDLIIIGGGFSALGSVASTAGSGVRDAAQPLAQAAGVSPEMLQQQAQSYLKPASPDPATMTPQDAQKEVVTNLATYAKGGSDAPAAKQRVIAIMAAQQHISTDDAAKQFDANEAKLKQARDQAVQTAKNAADESAAAASKTAFAGFGDLLLGAIAAAIGGSLAVQRRLQVSQRVVR